MNCQRRVEKNNSFAAEARGREGPLAGGPAPARSRGGSARTAEGPRGRGGPGEVGGGRAGAARSSAAPIRSRAGRAGRSLLSALPSASPGLWRPVWRPANCTRRPDGADSGGGGAPDRQRRGP